MAPRLPIATAVLLAALGVIVSASGGYLMFREFAAGDGAVLTLGTFSFAMGAIMLLAGAGFAALPATRRPVRQ